MSDARTKVPKILSRRFRRIANLLGEDEFAPHSEPNLNGGNNETRQNHRETTGNKHAETPQSHTLERESEQTPQTAMPSVHHEEPRQQHRSASPAPNLPPIKIPYKPFPLHATSSFSPGSVPKSKLRQLPQQIAAKYEAYSVPAARIAQMIDQSAQRSLAREREEMRKLRKSIEEARRRSGKAEDRERAGEEMARQARERMRRKLRRALAFREMELQFLVEGQRNAIDAIRLKEFLVLRPQRSIHISRELYTDVDKGRVDRIVAGWQ